MISGPPLVPTLSCVDLSEYVSGAVNMTVSWTLSGGTFLLTHMMDFWISPIPVSHTINWLVLWQVIIGYNIHVHGVNCGSQEGDESELLTITTQSVYKSNPNSNCNSKLHNHA